MKNKITLLHLAFLIFIKLNAQTVPQGNYLAQAKPFGSKTWGYINQNGQMVIQPKFEKCYAFSEDGYAVIFDHDDAINFYFIDTKGRKLSTQITGFQLIGFESVVIGTNIKGFNSGLVAVMKPDEDKKRKWGFMNTKGKLVVPLKYDWVSEFNNGFALVRMEKIFKVINTKGEEIIIENAENIINIHAFSNGFAAYKTKDKKWGYISPDGKSAFGPYIQADDFHDGLACVEVTKNKVGYIDTKGQIVIEPRFFAGNDFDSKSGLARIKVDPDTKGYVNKNNEIIYLKDPKDSWKDFSEGFAEGKKDSLRGFYNNKLEWAIEPQFKDVRPFVNGFALAREGDKWGIIDTNGKWVVQPNYAALKEFSVVK